MFYIFYGPDDFSLSRRVEEIKGTLGSGDMLAVNTARLDGMHLTLAELKSRCDVVPFLSPYRLVIVEGLLKRFDSRKGKAASDRQGKKSRAGMKEWQALPAYIQVMPTTTVLILVEGPIEARNSLFKKLSPLATTQYFPLLRLSDLKKWILQRVRKAGGKVTPGAVDILAEKVGGNLWVMNNEITKLLMYADGTLIRETDVEKVVGYVQEASIFSLVDAVILSQARVAQQLLHRLYQEGASAGYILAMVGRQLRLVLLAKELEPGLSPVEIRSRLGLSPKYPVGKLFGQFRRYNVSRIAEAYGKLVETDIAIKSGRYDERLALELLVFDLASARVT
ncbi:MAG: DNA polymerase III subunit delta [Chloroflexota bacterium]|nr:DNA polymerase III subunit delta [Chloroflexota bacterium]